MSTQRVKSNKRKTEGRRQFLRSSLFAGALLSVSLAGYIPLLQGSSIRLRPPGAVKSGSDEQEFFAACIKCGQCVQVCPVEAIKLADIDDGFGIGVPWIEARAQACDFSCDGLQCVLACPTGALTHKLNYPAESTMGFARLATPSRCLAVRGEGLKGAARPAPYAGKLRYPDIDRWVPQPVHAQQYDLELCDLCVRLCPIEQRIEQCAEGKPPSGDQNQCPPKHAIWLQPVAGGTSRQWQPEVLDGCVGCGVCEMVCPVSEPCIVIDDECDRLLLTDLPSQTAVVGNI
ncbi:MAG: 4Fe-4S binding protein [Gammaproteobacteria bacterium]|nr:4Fe-4S binding protein [Gammaproteobacteria bacterium]